MKATRREAFAVFLRALAWLPLCFAAWYVAADAVDWVPAKIAVPAIEAAAGTVARAQIAHRMVVYSVEIGRPYAGGAAARAEATVEVRAATYSFGIAIFVALALAARGWRFPGRLLLGTAVVLSLPAFGIAFDALRQLGQAPELMALLGWAPAAREAIALGYQVGSLLVPTLGPIVAWLGLFAGAWLARSATTPPVPRPPCGPRRGGC